MPVQASSMHRNEDLRMLMSIVAPYIDFTRTYQGSQFETVLKATNWTVLQSNHAGVLVALVSICNQCGSGRFTNFLLNHC